MYDWIVNKFIGTQPQGEYTVEVLSIVVHHDNLIASLRFNCLDVMHEHIDKLVRIDSLGNPVFYLSQDGLSQLLKLLPKL